MGEIQGARHANGYRHHGNVTFTVSESQRDAVVHDIANQYEHHRPIAFQDELRSLRTHNGFAYDER